jgi:hypothetical protein
MRIQRVLVVCSLLAGCSGDLIGGGRTDGGGLDAFVPPGTDTGVVSDGGPGVDAFVPPVDGGMEPPIDAGPCSGTTLAGAITTSTIPGASGSTRAFATSGGGALVGWQSSGAITLQHIDAAGAAFGAPVSIAGDGLWGVAASDSAYAALVSRGDQLVLVVTSTTGTVTHEERLMGNVPHDVTNNEWFGDLLRQGRLDWTGSQWITYSTVQRLWPDGIAHYGDTLRAFAADGTPASTFWGWGCSHSIDVRLAHGAGGDPTAVCSSDCYPGKGVFFMHDTQVFLDPSGNCMGFVAQHLGGVAPVSGGAWVGWTSAEGRGSQDPGLALVSGGSAGAPIWLSSDAGDASDMHLAPFMGGLVAAWNEGGSGHIVRLDAAGAVMGAIETIDGGLLGGADDFLVMANGDVGWAAGGTFARLRACR